MEWPGLDTKDGWPRVLITVKLDPTMQNADGKPYRLVVQGGQNDVDVETPGGPAPLGWEFVGYD